jgi:hypothetical protein
VWWVVAAYGFAMLHFQLSSEKREFLLAPLLSLKQAYSFPAAASPAGGGGDVECGRAPAGSGCGVGERLHPRDSDSGSARPTRERDPTGAAARMRAGMPTGGSFSGSLRSGAAGPVAALSRRGAASPGPPAPRSPILRPSRSPVLRPSPALRPLLPRRGAGCSLNADDSDDGRLLAASADMRTRALLGRKSYDLLRRDRSPEPTPAAALPASPQQLQAFLNQLALFAQQQQQQQPPPPQPQRPQRALSQQEEDSAGSALDDPLASPALRAAARRQRGAAAWDGPEPGWPAPGGAPRRSGDVDPARRERPRGGGRYDA